MASPEILDFEALLAPISDDMPAGMELKSDSAMSGYYYQVKDARDTARAAERRLIAPDEDDEEEASADWRPVASHGIDVIENNSKDLWVAAWLIESLCRSDGFAGLRDGFRLVRELSSEYWADINPRPDEDGYATTVAQLSGLNGDEAEGALIKPISDIPLTVSGLSHSSYKMAVDLQSITDPEKRQEKLDQGVVTLEHFEDAIRQSGGDFLRNLMEDIEQAIVEYTTMTQFLDDNSGENEYGEPAAPSSSNIRRALEECRDRLESLARPYLVTAGAEQYDEDQAGLITVDGVARAEGGGGSGRIVTRDDAFGALVRAVDYFRRTEPHSPVSYLLEQAIRWGQLSLPDLLEELVTDDDVRQSMFLRTGIRKNTGEAEDED